MSIVYRIYNFGTDGRKEIVYQKLHILLLFYYCVLVLKYAKRGNWRGRKERFRQGFIKKVYGRKT